MCFTLENNLDRTYLVHHVIDRRRNTNATDARQTGLQQKIHVEDIIKDMHTEDLISTSKLLWSSPIVLVKKIVSTTAR